MSEILRSFSDIVFGLGFRRVDAARNKTRAQEDVERYAAKLEAVEAQLESLRAIMQNKVLPDALIHAVDSSCADWYATGPQFTVKRIQRILERVG